MAAGSSNSAALFSQSYIQTEVSAQAHHPGSQLRLPWFLQVTSSCFGQSGPLFAGCLNRLNAYRSETQCSGVSTLLEAALNRSPKIYVVVIFQPQALQSRLSTNSFLHPCFVTVRKTTTWIIAKTQSVSIFALISLGRFITWFSSRPK